MVDTGQVQDVVAVQNNLTLQLLRIFLDLIVLDHDNNEVASMGIPFVHFPHPLRYDKAGVLIQYQQN